MEIERKDRALIQIVDAALAEGVRKSGQWLACRPGCTECCMGPFAISQLDALRLRRGLAELEIQDPERVARIRDRARASVARLENEFPGATVLRVLAEDEAAADEPCPALDPATGLCDLYASRPITCRTFGPPVRCGSEGVGVCELCFQGASDAEIAACEVEVDPDDLEAALVAELEQTSGLAGETIVAFALGQVSDASH